MLLAKRQGGTTVRGHTWEHDGDAVDVPYDLAMELLAIKGGGFYVPEPQDAAESSASKAKGKQDAPADIGRAAGAAAPAPPAAKPAAAK
jgi:hypothetical protein